MWQAGGSAGGRLQEKVVVGKGHARQHGVVVGKSKVQAGGGRKKGRQGHVS